MINNRKAKKDMNSSITGSDASNKHPLVDRIVSSSGASRLAMGSGSCYSFRQAKVRRQVEAQRSILVASVDVDLVATINSNNNNILPV